MAEKEKIRRKIEIEAVKAFAIAGQEPPVSDIVRRFEGQGASRATLYRWVKAAIDRDDEPTRQPAPDVAAETSAPAAPPISTAAEMPKATPVRPVDRGVSYQGSLGAVGILDSLQEAIEVARQCIAFGRKEDGTVRNSRLLLQASENLRRAIDTANRVYENVNDVRRVEAFHRRVMAEIGKESPPCRQRILDALTDMSLDGIL